jgi:hypothetical protein
MSPAVMGMAGRASLRWRGIRQSENKPLSVMADCRPFYQPHIDWRIFNSSRPMHCSTGLEMSKTASEDHKVMVCKKHGVPSDARYGGKGRRGALQRQRWCLITQVRRALLGTRRYLGVPPRVLKQVKGTTPVLIPWAVCRNASGGSLFPFRHTLLSELVVEAVCPMSDDHERNEFGLLLGQFHAVVRGGSDSIEGIFDAEFSSPLQRVDKSSGRAGPT